MKTEKNVNKMGRKDKINSLEELKELYFPKSYEKEKMKLNDPKNYGSMIAMTILDGINKDLRTGINP